MWDFLLNALAQVATVRSYAVAAQELVQQSNMMKLLAPAKPNRLGNDETWDGDETSKKSGNL